MTSSSDPRPDAPEGGLAASDDLPTIDRDRFDQPGVYTTIQLVTDARKLPGEVDADVTAVTLPSSHGLYWTRTSGKSWLWHPAEGYVSAGGRNEEEKAGRPFYCPIAPPGALVALSHRDPDGTPHWMSYRKRVDRSEGGTYFYKNVSGQPWTLRFYMNDSRNTGSYADNLGVMSHEIVIFQL